MVLYFSDLGNREQQRQKKDLYYYKDLYSMFEPKHTLLTLFAYKTFF
jgi:hypothetical protein